ncbi:hypothetical protein RD792_014464 [Penstemon davidsonii]|uniref:Protein kinase domain-containing protein n=1 Tax=Penstemon davidsonii TaxID=160366 RepID=A0ABR0CPI8_9LAMI|nr:hypothetical protein RD792_014464 [Penstemon davidsonii]
MGEVATSSLIYLGALYLMITQIWLVYSSNMSTDESSLLAFKAQITYDDPNNIMAKNWSQESSLCTWIGVTCSRRRPRVTGLDLVNIGLQGTIANEIGNLSFLKYLNISNNSFRGQIPYEIGHLRRLRVLRISFNQLNGQIPLSFGLLISLEIFNLRGNNLIGTIPCTIFNLSSLLRIDLAINQISGALPPSICHHLSKLKFLSLSKNQLGGNIPPSLTTCAGLNVISLSYNNFTGNIPMKIGNLSQLQYLTFGRNNMTGTIPISVTNMSNLETLDLSWNSFHGQIPSGMGRLSNLTWITLDENKLNGDVPQSIFNLSRLEVLSIPMNELSGNLPFSIDKGLSNIQRLYLGTNRFRGRIPESISNLSKLITLSINHNLLSGHIPITLGNLQELQILRLGGNQFTNDLSTPEQDFLTPLTKCKYIIIIDASDNLITGVIPKSLGSGNLSFLHYFDFGQCKLRGSIPNEIGNLSSNLFWLGLGYNGLNGVIPESLRKLRSLQRLEINGNNLQDSIPHSFCDLKKLYYLNLWGNKLNGKLPSCLGDLISLREIYLNENAFNSIPSTFWSNEFIQKIYLDNNFFDGPMPPEIGNMKSAIEISLSGNQFSGGIPSSIEQLQFLTYLDLSNNKLDDQIPQYFASLKEFEHLDISRNNISGSIPPSFESLAYLDYFNVSFNELSGEIPDGGPFRNFTAEFFINNKGLCGASRFKVEVCKKNEHRPSVKNIVLRYTLPSIAIVVIAITIVILFTRHRRGASSFSPLLNTPLRLAHERISYYEIVRATRNFDEENLIGRGGLALVYKGIFSDEMTAAVKVFNLDVQSAFKSFDTECLIMRSIRHKNLVKVITSCSNLDFKALVMEYMPNGNLEKWLYSPNSHSNIGQRLGIMIYVASALEYLHQGCSSPIVHCDIKPSNILLDKDMIARVGDFGISKLLMKDQEAPQTRTLGTIGYMAPEYGSAGLVTTMVDAYSFGILLMEMFTKKSPTYEMFFGELTMRRWVSESFPNSIMQIIDAELLKENERTKSLTHQKSLTSIMGLALECTADVPEERLDMKDVLKRLKMIKTEFTGGRGHK